MISPDTVERLLNEDGYSLQGNAKTVEGKQHPDRNGQFRHINALVTAFQAAGNRSISVDTKKKELVGNYKNGGKERRPKGTPERVKVHDFQGELGRAVPYGVYDMTANAGWVTSAPTPTPAVRGRVDPPLVEQDRQGRLPRCQAAAHHRRLRRFQRRRLGVEGRAGQARHRARP